MSKELVRLFEEYQRAVFQNISDYCDGTQDRGIEDKLLAALEAVQEESPIPSTGLTQTVVEFVNQRIDSELTKINELFTNHTQHNAYIRKRVDATEQRCAALERKVEHLELKTLGQYHESFVKPQPFDPTAMPKVGDKVYCVDSDIWDEGWCHERFDGVVVVKCVNDKGSWDYKNGRGVMYTWDDRFRRLDPASKDKPHNPTCLCKDCHEDKQPATLPPFQDVETLRRMTGPERWDYYANFIECVPPEILQSQTSSMEFVLEAVKSFLSNSRLDQQRIIQHFVPAFKTLHKEAPLLTAYQIQEFIERTLREAGCDKI